MANEIQQFFRDHGISEVEAIIPDMAGIARGKIMPAEKFAEDEGMRLPESIFLQTVTGDYPPDTGEAMSPAEIDIVLKADPKTVRARAVGGRAHRAGDPRLLLFRRPPRRPWRRATCCATCSSCTPQRGWEPVVAPELEFYLVEPNIDADYPLKPPVGRSGRAEPGRQSYSIAAVNEFDPLFDDIYQFCEDQDIEIDTLIHEDGAGADGDQPAARRSAGSRRPGLPVQAHGARGRAAPQDVRHVHGQAARQGARQRHAHPPERRRHEDRARTSSATRTARPRRCSSRTSPACRSTCRPAMALFAPNVNSYRRITRYQLGADQRAVGLRQPHRGPARADVRSRRAPRREPARRRGRQPVHRDRRLARLRLSRHGRGPAADRADHRQRARSAVRAAALARRRPARAAASASRWCSMLGEPFVSAYTIVKEAEYEVFLQVISSWEREHLLLNV